MELITRWARSRYRGRPVDRVMLVTIDVVWVGLLALVGFGVWYLVTGWRS